MIEWFGKTLRAYANKDGRGYPDWALRYLPVVRRFRKKYDLAHARILEIGGNETGFARFANVPTICANLSFDELRCARTAQNILPVAADIAALPFRSEAFDICVCMDTLEHIPAASRPAALASITSVLSPSGTAVIGFPSGKAAASAEREIIARCRRAGIEPLHWFSEHVELELPDAEAVRQEVERMVENTHDVRQNNNTNVWVWKWVWLALACGWPGRGNAVLQALVRLATPILSRIHFGACYRVLVWIKPKHTNRLAVQ